MGSGGNHHIRPFDPMASRFLRAGIADCGRTPQRPRCLRRDRNHLRRMYFARTPTANVPAVAKRKEHEIRATVNRCVVIGVTLRPTPRRSPVGDSVTISPRHSSKSSRRRLKLSGIELRHELFNARAIVCHFSAPQVIRSSLGVMQGGLDETWSRRLIRLQT